MQGLFFCIAVDTAFQKACSPVHSRSHCSFSMCHTPASHWSLPPPTASILCLSRLSSRVALAQLVPRRSSGAPGISTGMFSICEHFAARAHLLSSALSHFHISISSVSSCSELHAHCSHARLRSRSVSCRATSSCLRHRCKWRHSSLPHVHQCFIHLALVLPSPLNDHRTRFFLIDFQPAPELKLPDRL